MMIEQRLIVVCLIFLLVLVTGANAAGDTVRPHIYRYVEAISEDNEVEYQMYPGTSDLTEGLPRYFFSFCTEATIEELVHLTEHSESVVRCYAFLALVERQSEAALPVFLHHLNDDENVRTSVGCFSLTNQTVVNFFLEALAYGGTSDSCFLDEYQRTIFDSLLLFHPDRFRWVPRGMVLPHVNPMFYTEIRRILLEEGFSDMIIPLARYRKEQDKELILEFLRDTSLYRRECGLSAISIFPDRTFEPVLQAIGAELTAELWRLDKGWQLVSNYCNAIVQYKTRWARTYMQKILVQYPTSVWYALDAYPDSHIFKGLQQTAFDRIRKWEVWGQRSSEEIRRLLRLHGSQVR